jgi:hypothetical protein
MNPVRGSDISFDASIAGPCTLIHKTLERLAAIEAELTAALVIAPFAIAVLAALRAF